MAKINKALIANRGEIAVRIIRTLQKMQIKSVAVYASDDQSGSHVKMADEKIMLSGNILSETYLNIDQLITIALQTGADAIHPGYGFLSENPDFAQACYENGIIFIGPSADSIKLMGNKVAARKFVKSIGIPIIEGMTVDASEAVGLRDEISYPVIIKAAAGGGGKGMRIVYNPHELVNEIETSQREVKSYFGNGDIYLEKYIKGPRHIEVQLLSDHHGNHVHLFERECSLQRRYQKIIEEAPAASISAETRKKLHDAALKIADSMNYRNAGTIEFLVDTSENIYFLEMNTRIQVEHPVTEEITGTDIVEMQVKIARDEQLPFNQEDIKIRGHAIEARVYAEDPENRFIPSPGKIDYLQLPNESRVRVETWLHSANEISSSYDPLIAKIISSGKTREEATNTMIHALHQTAVHGVKNNVGYLQKLLSEMDFRHNNISTQFIENMHDTLINNMVDEQNNQDMVVPALAAILYGTTRYYAHDPWFSAGNWRNFNIIPYSVGGYQGQVKISRLTPKSVHLYPDVNFGYNVMGNQVSFSLASGDIQLIVSRKNKNTYFVTSNSITFEVTRQDALNEENNEKRYTSAINASAKNGHVVVSPLTGKVVKVNVSNGTKVSKGDILMVIESMKMENKILSLADGTVENLAVIPGQQVQGNQALMVVKQEVELNKMK